MRILIIGYGSAGQRHARVLSSKFKVESIYIKTKQNFKNKKKIIFVKTINNLNPDLIVVANETAKHYKTCLDIEKNFKKKLIVVEKPLFHKFYDFKPKKNKYYVAYNLRYHPILRFIKNKFNNEEPFYIEAESSSYLPSWRKNIDYRNSYSSDRLKGGGAVLDLSHEIDYLFWLFKGLKLKRIIKKKISNLKIRSEDFSLILGNFKKNEIVKIKLTYFNMLARRVLNVCFKNNTQIYADLLSSKLEIFSDKKKKIVRFKKFTQDESTKDFYKDLILGKNKIACTLNEGLNLLKKIKKK
ncbi:Gfo/Idh/MocA family oxidoreductase [Candidatus Pelagibacter sp.]|nr:Gfo/Idh/MocA family oxidoreductase [Candidatus Pelagibacter sp.]